MKNSTSTHEDGIDTRKNTISKIGGAAALSLAIFTAPVQEAMAQTQIRAGKCANVSPVQIEKPTGGGWKYKDNELKQECIHTSDRQQYTLNISPDDPNYILLAWNQNGQQESQRIFYPATSFKHHNPEVPKLPFSFTATSEAPSFTSEVADILNARQLEATKAKINQGNSEVCKGLRYYHKLPADILYSNVKGWAPNGFIYNGTEILKEEKKHYPDLIKQCEAKGL